MEMFARNITNAFLQGIFPVALRNSVRAKRSETIEHAATHLRDQYARYANYTNINNAMHPTAPTNSTEGKVADAVLAPPKAYTTPYATCLNNINCTLFPGKPVHKFFDQNICRSFSKWKK
jgi:hypothetical protein